MVSCTFLRRSASCVIVLGNHIRSILCLYCEKICNESNIIWWFQPSLFFWWQENLHIGWQESLLLWMTRKPSSFDDKKAFIWMTRKPSSFDDNKDIGFVSQKDSWMLVLKSLGHAGTRLSWHILQWLCRLQACCSVLANVISSCCSRAEGRRPCLVVFDQLQMSGSAQAHLTESTQRICAVLLWLTLPASPGPLPAWAVRGLQTSPVGETTGLSPCLDVCILAYITISICSKALALFSHLL